MRCPEPVNYRTKCADHINFASSGNSGHDHYHVLEWFYVDGPSPRRTPGHAFSKNARMSSASSCGCLNARFTDFTSSRIYGSEVKTLNDGQDIANRPPTSSPLPS